MKNKLHYSFKLFVLAVGLIIFNQAKAQYSLDWAHEYRLGAINPYTVEIATDGANNSYVIGNIWDTLDVDFNSAVTNEVTNVNNGSAFFIAKYNSSSDLVWVKRFANEGVTIDFSSLHADAGGNVYVTGTTISLDSTATIDVDPGTGTALIGINKGYILKLNTSGDFQWVKEIDFQNILSTHKVITDNNGNVYVSGEFFGTINFGPPLNVTLSSGQISGNSGHAAGYIAKYSSSGQFEWAKPLYQHLPFSFGSNTRIKLASINVSPTAIYVGGHYQGNIDFNPGSDIDTLGLVVPNIFFIRYAFIAKYDLNGNFNFVKRFNGYSFCLNTKLDGSGNIYMLGYYGGTLDADPNNGVSNITSNNSSEDLFLVKLDTSGSFNWAKTWGGSLNEFDGDFKIDSGGNLLITGNFNGSVDFNPGADTTSFTSNGFDDCYLLKLNANGDYVSNYTWGGSSYDYAYRLHLDNSGNIIIGGQHFSTDMDYDGFNRGGVGTYFLMKIIPTAPSSIFETNENSFVVYPNPAATQFTIANAEPGTRISIIDMAGKLIQAETVSTTNHTVYIDGLANGMYIIQLENNGQISQKKLVINK